MVKKVILAGIMLLFTVCLTQGFAGKNSDVWTIEVPPAEMEIREPGGQRLFEKQYQLTMRGEKRENHGDERTLENRYGRSKDTRCIALAKRAYRFLLNSQYEKAKSLYTRALRCLPNNTAVWNDYGVSCYKLGQYEIAERALKKAIELNRNYALAYRNLAVIAWQKHHYERGRQMAVRAAELDPSDENLRYAAHAYELLSEQQRRAAKRRSLKKAAEYYRRIKNISRSSQESLDKIEKFLRRH